MAGRLKGFLSSRKTAVGLKLVAAAFVVFLVLQAFFINGMNPYYTISEDQYQNDFAADQVETISEATVSQHFVANGNVIINIFLYLDSKDSGIVDISLSDLNGKVLKSAVVDLKDYTAGAWNTVAFDCDNLKMGREYVLNIHAEEGLCSLLLNRGEIPEAFGICAVGQDVVDGGLAIGIQQTYVRITLASALELLFHLLVTILLTLALCYSIFHIEKLWKVFITSEKKKGLLYALYFAVTLVFLFNPIDPARTEVISFGRIIGSGFINNVDVSRRISNFSLWFIFFCAAVGLLYVLINSFKQKDGSGEKKKVMNFLDQLMILADVNLLFRCITYFSDRTNAQAPFYYSTAMIQLVVILSVAYLVFNLDKKLPAELYLKLEIIAFSITYPIAIISQQEWQSGKLLFGFQAVIMLSVIILVYIFVDCTKSEKCEAAVTSGAVCAAMVPFAASFYIELINILNQHEVFVANLRKYYIVAICIMFFAAVFLILCTGKAGIAFSKWKVWSYSWLIFGITCLSVQIPLVGTYNAHIFETANSSILISDFLNFGDIPLVQHYGGHMMSGVWEGLIYAVLNNDYAGAIFSPYSGYITPVLAVLFFALIRKIWDEDLALLATLFFPFMSSTWPYYGLGMLVCLAAWSYIKKNTYSRAALVWLAFIWCALYRLDLGASIGIACILAMIVFVLTGRNWTAAKQLSITLVMWGVFGGGLWVILCCVKGIHPINRLLEFLTIGLSNQNWAYDNIGTTGNTIFAWCYLVIPFVMAGSLLYTVFFEKFKENAGDMKWFALLILGFSYFTNFSRGLVRHSLAEINLTIVLWDAHLFLAVFFSVYKRKREWFLPAFALLILCNTFFLKADNFNETPIGDAGAARLGTFTETWTTEDDSQTYWEELQEAGEKVTRVKWDETLHSTIEPYALVLDMLLEENETFVDFINKSFVYSAINRRNPVYVSQSPLQLSGEFAQKMFVEEIKDIPVVLMPLDDFNLASYLDGIPNAYRYYKVAEYIYQNYIPLCRHGTSFAVWCLPEKYEGYREKIFENTTNYMKTFGAADQLNFWNCERRVDETSGDTLIVCTENDPQITELQTVIDLAPYIGEDVSIFIEYDTDTSGLMQIFYTSDDMEDYTGEKVVGTTISGRGVAEFVLPVTEFTRLRLDPLPGVGTVAIRSLTVNYPVLPAAYGYDGPDEVVDGYGNISYSYSKGFHTYFINHLPNIWAENDEAINNRVCCELSNQDGVYIFDQSQIALDENGNYLRIRVDYAGEDHGADYHDDDEAVSAIVKVGIYNDGRFIEKYQYYLTVLEGCHDYLIRISSDYNWYLREVNAVAIFSDGALHDISMSILEGD